MGSRQTKGCSDDDANFFSRGPHEEGRNPFAVRAQSRVSKRAKREFQGVKAWVPSMPAPGCSRPPV
eukprot:462010-Rhodomonas_salina.1